MVAWQAKGSYDVTGYLCLENNGYFTLVEIRFV